MDMKQNEDQMKKSSKKSSPEVKQGSLAIHKKVSESNKIYRMVEKSVKKSSELMPEVYFAKRKNRVYSKVIKIEEFDISGEGRFYIVESEIRGTSYPMYMISSIDNISRLMINNGYYICNFGIRGMSETGLKYIFTIKKAIS